MTCHIGDVVYITWGSDMAIGRINKLCSIDGECMAFVCIWTRLPQVNMFHDNGECYFVLLIDIVDTCIYKIERDVAYVVPPRGAVHDALVKKR